MPTYYTRKDEVHLKAGEKLGFTTGRGYYAIAAPPKPSAPPATTPVVTHTQTGSTGGGSGSGGGSGTSGGSSGSGGGSPTSGGGSAGGEAPSQTNIATTTVTTHVVQPTSVIADLDDRPTTKVGLAATRPSSTSSPTVAYKPPAFEPARKAQPSAELQKTAQAHVLVAVEAKRATSTKPEPKAVIASQTAQPKKATSSETKPITLQKPISKPAQPATHTSIPQTNPQTLRQPQSSFQNDPPGKGTQKPAKKQPEPTLTAKQRADLLKLQHASLGGVKIANPKLTVLAAAKAKIPLPLALAILSQESHGGRNEWGHDPTICVGGHDKVHGKAWGSNVTKAAYSAYKAERGPTGKGGMQGVGPTQLTYYSYQDEADKLGGAWKPLPNMIEGFTVIRESVQRSGLFLGIKSYNGSGDAAAAYAASVLRYEKAWAAKLGMPSMQSRG
jgi:hypothetical protein